MNQHIGEAPTTAGWQLYQAAGEGTLADLVARCPVLLPRAYLAFLRRSNGGEGAVRDRYVRLWSAENVLAWNRSYGIPDVMPGTLAVGNDGGSRAYVFDGRDHSDNPPILRVHLCRLGFEHADVVAADFASLLAPGPDARLAAPSMLPQLDADAALRPGLFLWNGAIPEADLDAWLDARRLVVPADLRRLWTITGGGELFESEDLWAPLAPPPVGYPEDFESINRQYRDRGMASIYLVYHTGLGVSAVRQPDGALVSLSPQALSEIGTFSALDAWYAWLRLEYAERYGLPPRSS